MGECSIFIPCLRFFFKLEISIYTNLFHCDAVLGQMKQVWCGTFSDKFAGVLVTVLQLAPSYFHREIFLPPTSRKKQRNTPVLDLYFLVNTYSVWNKLDFEKCNQEIALSSFVKYSFRQPVSVFCVTSLTEKASQIYFVSLICSLKILCTKHNFDYFTLFISLYLCHFTGLRTNLKL